MKVSDVNDVEALRVWRKGGNVEIDDLLLQMNSWEVGKTKLVQLEKGVKALQKILRKEFSGRNTVYAKAIDKEGFKWHVKRDKLQRRRRNKLGELQESNA